MQVEQWRNAIGEMVRDHMRSPELEYYFSVKMNKQRAQLMITQLGLYIRHRVRRSNQGSVFRIRPSSSDHPPSGKTRLKRPRGCRHQTPFKHDRDALRLGLADAR